VKTQFCKIAALLLAILLTLPACTVTEDTETDAPDTTAETVADTETEAVTEDNSLTPPTLPAMDSYQGMTTDVPYTLNFYSYGDGTCAVMDIVVNMLYEGTYTVEIPETSPDGDTVVEVNYIKSTYNLPRYLTPAAYKTMVGWWEDYFDRCVEQGLLEADRVDFELRRARSYYLLRDASLSSTENLAADMIAQYPLCEHIPVYVLDISTTEVEMAHISQLMAAAAPWYTTEWCYADLLTMEGLADSFGVEDPYLEKCLAEHSESLAGAEAVRIPRTVTQLLDNLQTLSSMGVTRLIYDGTAAEFDAIFSGQTAKLTLPYPMTVQCTDGELTLDNLEVRYPALTE
jgi:hypothetical protein